MPDDLNNISGAEEPEKCTREGSPWKGLEVDGPSFSDGLKDLAARLKEGGKRSFCLLS